MSHSPQQNLITWTCHRRPPAQFTSSGLSLLRRSICCRNKAIFPVKWRLACLRCLCVHGRSVSFQSFWRVHRPQCSHPRTTCIKRTVYPTTNEKQGIRTLIDACSHIKVLYRASCDSWHVGQGAARYALAPNQLRARILATREQGKR